MEQADAALNRLYTALRDLPAGGVAQRSAHTGRFIEVMNDDFNTPAALGAAFEWVREANRAPAGSGDADLREMLSVLGLDNLLDVGEVQAPADVVELAEARERARAARDYAEADRLREQIRGHGWEVRDGPDGPELLPAA